MICVASISATGLNRRVARLRQFRNEHVEAKRRLCEGNLRLVVAVAKRYRNRGVGRALVEAAEQWAREQGCRELASDAQAGNEDSHRAHLACGFEDAGLVRCFRKVL